MSKQVERDSMENLVSGYVELVYSTDSIVTKAKKGARAFRTIRKREMIYGQRTMSESGLQAVTAASE